MDVIFHGMMLGFSVATTLTNLWCAFLGVWIGTFVGVMPGLGTTASIAILLPITIGMAPASAIILMASIYCGAKYGGAVTSILMNLPGETSSVPTCMDGYPMAMQGRAGHALGIASIGGFVGGTASVIGLMVVGPFLSYVAMSFGPPEYFALTTMGLCLVTSLTGKSLIKGAIAVCFGITLSAVGGDIMTGATRLTFGVMEINDGIDFAIVAVGLFAISEVLMNMGEEVKMTLMKVPKKLSELLPSTKEIVQCIPTLFRSTLVGFGVGMLPGTGPGIASFLSYGVAKSVSKTPERFGKGAIEGVCASETADNAATGATLSHTLTMGIPGSSSTAMMMAALVMTGVRPGPLLLQNNPEVFWGVVASMYIANIMLIIINLPLIPVIVQFTKIPYYILYIIVITITAVGAYSIDNSMFDVAMMGVFGILGYILRKLDYPLAPLILALILGPIVERSLRQSLIMSLGSPGIFFTRPIAACLLGVAILAFFAPWFQRMLAKRSGRT